MLEEQPTFGAPLASHQHWLEFLKRHMSPLSNCITPVFSLSVFLASIKWQKYNMNRRKNCGCYPLSSLNGILVVEKDTDSYRPSTVK